MSTVALYSSAHTDRRSLSIQGVSPPSGFRSFKVFLVDPNGYDGGSYVLHIPRGSNNCEAELQEQGMDVRQVAVW